MNQLPLLQMNTLIFWILKSITCAPTTHLLISLNCFAPLPYACRTDLWCTSPPPRSTKHHAFTTWHTRSKFRQLTKLRLFLLKLPSLPKSYRSAHILAGWGLNRACSWTPANPKSSSFLPACTAYKMPRGERTNHFCHRKIRFLFNRVLFYSCSLYAERFPVGEALI